MDLKTAIQKARQNRVAIGHFNVSDISTLMAVFEAAQSLSLGQEELLPIVIGVSEGEREALGVKTIARIVQGLRKDFSYPIFLNADHTRSLKKIEEAVFAGFDMVIFDAAQLSLAENMEQSRAAVKLAKSINPEILVEGELGYIGTGSQMLDALPKDAAITIEQAVKVEEAERFIKGTGIDLFAPAVGNIHGMLKKGSNPRLFINRIQELSRVIAVPLVLHGGSGISDDDFVAAIQAGIAMIHISTELRRAWRQGLEAGLDSDKNELTPYKILASSKKAVRQVVENRIRLFNSF